MTPEQAGLLVLMLLCIVAIVAMIYWLICSVANDQKKSTEIVRRAKQDAIDQVVRDSRLGETRIWLHDDSVVTHLGNSEGIPKGIQATNLKISEQDAVIRFCQCYYADASNVWDTHSGNFKREPSEIAEIKFEDVISAEISLNEERTDFQAGTIQGKTKGALIGTLLFGVAGGVVGSAGERKINSITKSSNKITSLAIEISTTNQSMPFIFIYFYSAIHTISTAFSETPLGVSAEEIRELPQFKQMRQWYSALQKSIASNKTQESVSSTDLSDQLGKLAELHRQGKLTDEEYRIAKQKILDA
jgi:type II secretory pathway pseudopilin PulG